MQRDDLAAAEMHLVEAHHLQQARGALAGRRGGAAPSSPGCGAMQGDGGRGRTRSCASARSVNSPLSGRRAPRARATGVEARIAAARSQRQPGRDAVQRGGGALGSRAGDAGAAGQRSSQSGDRRAAGDDGGHRSSGTCHHLYGKLAVRGGRSAIARGRELSASSVSHYLQVLSLDRWRMPASRRDWQAWPLERHASRLSARASPKRLDRRWSEWFDGLSIVSDEQSTARRMAKSPIKSALHALLRKLRDLGRSCCRPSSACRAEGELACGDSSSTPAAGRWRWPARSRLATFVAALIGLLIDPRVITGAPAWHSSGQSLAYRSPSTSCTLLWLLSFVTWTRAHCWRRRLGDLRSGCCSSSRSSSPRSCAAPPAPLQRRHGARRAAVQHHGQHASSSCG